MTDKFKKRVREHAAKHGMSYQAARQQMDRADAPTPEVRVATATLYTGEEVTFEVVRDGDADPWRPRSQKDQELFRSAGVVTVDGQVVKSRTGPRGGIGTGVDVEDRLDLIKDEEGRRLFEEMCQKCRDGKIEPRAVAAILDAYLGVQDPDSSSTYELPPDEDERTTSSAGTSFKAWTRFLRGEPRTSRIRGEDFLTALAKAFAETAPERKRNVEDELEQERVRLAAAGCAALGYASASDVPRGSYGHSASFDDVERLYQEHRAALGLVGAFWQLLEDIDGLGSVVDEKGYRRLVRRAADRRHDTGVVAESGRIFIRGWPLDRRDGAWLDRFDPRKADSIPVLGQLSPDIFRD